jgi:hypothetical protein
VADKQEAELVYEKLRLAGAVKKLADPADVSLKFLKNVGGQPQRRRKGDSQLGGRPLR